MCSIPVHCERAACSVTGSTPGDRERDVGSASSVATLRTPALPESVGLVLWVLAALQTAPARRRLRRARLPEKSKTGIKAPKQEVDLIRQRLKSIQEELQ
jgi:hypothetical protein